MRNKQMFKKQTDLGQSLVEVLIAILVVTLVLIAVVSSVIVGIKSADFSERKARATFLAQEVIEWLRNQKQDVGWGEFAGYASAAGVVYCLEDLSEDFETVMANIGDCGEGERIDDIYARSVILTADVAEPDVGVEVTVSWFEGGSERFSYVSAIFSEYDYQN